MKTKKEIEQRVSDIDKRIDFLMDEFNNREHLPVQDQYKNKYERDGLYAERRILHWVLNGKM